MKDRLLLTGWLLSVVVITLVQDPFFLAGLLLLLFAFMGASAPHAALRALAAVALVNISISLAYVISAWLAGEDWIAFVLRLNLRVLLLTLLAFAVIENVDLARASKPWPSLQFLVVLALGQIRKLNELLTDYRLAFLSRSPTRPSIKMRLGSVGSQAAAMMEKAERRAEELNHGMRARGFFDDRA